MRNWLNKTFLSSTFGKEEQERILESTNVNAANDEYGIDGGNNTMDKIFLLSIDEVNKYFTSSLDSQAEHHRSFEKHWWWLRSPGGDGERAAFVSYSGEIDTYGISKLADGGVRPAMWVDTSDIE